MIRTVIIQHVTDGTYEYQIGDKVRIKMKPKDPFKPEWADEYIGVIYDIRKDMIALDIPHLEQRYLPVCDIDKMRWAEPDETFENTWEF